MATQQNSSGIIKKIINAGEGDSCFPDGTKVTFHVRTTKCENEEVIDDSKKWKEPVELILGKKFKLEVWEACIRTMKLGEISDFEVNEELLASFPMVSKTLRDYHAKKAGKNVESRSHHCCGIGMKEGLGYADLDELVNKPQDLKFRIELLTIEGVGSYEKEFWAMSEEERVASVHSLREEGNALYKEEAYAAASKKYSEAIGRLENLMLKEKPNDVDWNELNAHKLRLLLNYAQCQLIFEEYYSVIEHCSEVLKYEPENVKALFRRGKAYVKVYSSKEAKDDLEKASELDKSLVGGCKKLLNELAACEKEKLVEDKKAFQRIFS